MAWDYIQLVFLLMAVAWLVFILIAIGISLYEEKIIKIGRTILLIMGVVIPMVYLIGLIFWRVFQMVS